MVKLWICVALAAFVGVLGHADSNSNWFYDDNFEYSDEMDKLSDIAQNYPEFDRVNGDEPKPTLKPEILESIDDITDKKGDEEIENLQDDNAENLEEDLDEDEDNEEVDDIDEYQIEDNRSEVKEEKQDFVDDMNYVETNDKEIEPVDENENSKDTIKDYDLLDDVVIINEEQESNEEPSEQEAPEESPNDLKDDHENKVSTEIDEDHDKMTTIPGETITQNNASSDYQSLVADQEYDADDKQEIDDAKRFLEETDDTDGGFPDSEPVNSNIKGVIDETKQILTETNDAFDEEENVDVDENDEGGENIEEDGKVQVDVNNDEEEMVEEDEEEMVEEDGEEMVDEGESENIDSQAREDYEGRLKNNYTVSAESEDIDDDNVDEAYNDLMEDINKLRETWNKLKDDAGDAEVDKEDLPGFAEINTKLAEMVQEVGEDDDYEEIDDKDLSKIFEDISDEDEADDNNDAEEEETDDVEPDVADTEAWVNDSIHLSDIKDAKVSENSKIIQYVDDALVANEIGSTKSDVETSTATSTVKEHMIEPLEDNPNDELSSAEFSKLINNVIGNQVPESQTNYVEPRRITLNLEEPVVLTSPNYPSPYPTNTVIDWILEGEGMGIEFNVTDFAVNGAAGHFVMVKPGRIDPSGADGLLFTHTLNEERRFRFLNVDRMFIRFEAKEGMAWQRGFSFSAKMIAPIPEENVEEPETLPIGFPPHTLTLNLGGVTLDAFLPLRAEFRQILADMATVYINANLLDPGLNTTSEVTQITSTAMCNHNWPQFESCVEVRFGVPLQYADEGAPSRLDEEDLRDMWLSYSPQDPFALRIRRLGITEFQVPNDSNVLMVWLVIAAGVVVSMAMLAFALWRFSCFEDYTRMPSFSDTESVNEKKTLDLYPTPHQTLPPLYADSADPWGHAKYDDTRVDMGGFTSRGYERTEDYEFDSEEDTPRPRDRYTTDV